MTEHKIVMPKLGESIQEATITRWFVKPGDRVEEDTPLFEVATDKVDSEIPSPYEGLVTKIFYSENAVVPVGEVVAVIQYEENSIADTGLDKPLDNEPADYRNADRKSGSDVTGNESRNRGVGEMSNRFFSPLVKKIAAEEKLSPEELGNIPGSGTGGRVQKKDILQYLVQRKKFIKKEERTMEQPVLQIDSGDFHHDTASAKTGAGDTIIEMDRIRKLIAGHMLMSKQVSPHVTTVVEADVTNLVLWRNRVKGEFQARYGEKLTYMPVFIEATAKALREFPFVNASVDGDKIILRKNVNIGIAVARPDGNLIVPVIKHADEKNLAGLAKNLNQLAEAARTNKLAPGDIQDGTFSITNFGSFRNLIGTPIIHQPQVAILATGSIEKKPSVLETPAGDVIAIRHKMYLSLSYDHRIVDGALGGAFLRRIADILEEFNLYRSF
jgi:2-oxoglutarate dehydrogenase E2 component (dihydrolipoamide succinyltransferase)